MVSPDTWRDIHGIMLKEGWHYKPNFISLWGQWSTKLLNCLAWLTGLDISSTSHAMHRLGLVSAVGQETEGLSQIGC